jgi:drug/metabolite transporter (DMT)-like permease
LLPKVEVAYESNRSKAIVFMNLFCFFAFIYMVMTKYAIYSYGIHALDLCLYRTFILTAAAFAIARVSKKPILVDPRAHKDLFLRSFFGTIGFTTFVYAVKYLPLGIHSIVFNTAPFISSAISWLILKEAPSRG